MKNIDKTLKVVLDNQLIVRPSFPRKLGGWDCGRWAYTSEIGRYFEVHEWSEDKYEAVVLAVSEIEKSQNDSMGGVTK